MKTHCILSAALIAGLLAPVAQASSNRTLNGALLGGIAGAVIGHNSGDGDAWKGAAIGTAAGALIGAASEENHRDHSRREHDAYRYPRHSYFHNSHDRYYHTAHFGTYGGYGYRSAFDCSPGYSYGYYRPSYANRGLIIGGLAGGIIGHNSRRFHHDTWRGVAIGAGAGWLLGTWADARHRETPCYDNNVCNPVPNQNPELAENTSGAPAPASTPAPQTVIINNYYTTTPMSSANSLFGR